MNKSKNIKIIKNAYLRFLFMLTQQRTVLSYFAIEVQTPLYPQNKKKHKHKICSLKIFIFTKILPKTTSEFIL